MRLLVNVDGVDTAIIGYMANAKNVPMAVVAPWPNPDGTYGIRAVNLSDIRLDDIPPGLRRRLNRRATKGRKAAAEETRP